MAEETTIERWARVLEAHSKTPAWLAKLVGCERSTITRILKGERRATRATAEGIEWALLRLTNGTTRESAFEDCRAALRGLPYEDQIEVLDLLYDAATVLRREARCIRDGGTMPERNCGETRP